MRENFGENSVVQFMGGAALGVESDDHVERSDQSLANLTKRVGRSGTAPEKVHKWEA